MQFDPTSFYVDQLDLFGTVMIKLFEPPEQLPEESTLLLKEPETVEHEAVLEERFKIEWLEEMYLALRFNGFE